MSGFHDVQADYPEGLLADVSDARRMLSQFESGQGTFDIAPMTVRGLLDGIYKMQTAHAKRIALMQ